MTLLTTLAPSKPLTPTSDYVGIALTYLLLAKQESSADVNVAWPENSPEIPVTTALDNTIQRAIWTTTNLQGEDD